MAGIIGLITANLPHIINGVKKGIGANTKIGRKLNAHKVFDALKGKEKAPLDLNDNGVIEDNELALAQIQANELKAKRIAYTGWALIFIIVEITYPEINEKVFNLVLQFLN